jgi:hypothetical protein
MDDPSNPTATLDQTDEEILAYDASDEALEAAAGTERGILTLYPQLTYDAHIYCC